MKKMSKCVLGIDPAPCDSLSAFSNLKIVFLQRGSTATFYQTYILFSIAYNIMFCTQPHISKP